MDERAASARIRNKDDNRIFRFISVQLAKRPDVGEANDELRGSTRNILLLIDAVAQLGDFASRELRRIGGISQRVPRQSR
jgi:hypothetical protein